MNWILVFISGLITYFLRYSMISLIKKDMLSERTRTLLSYVPSAVFPALIFPAIILDENASLVSHDNPKIIAIIVAIIKGKNMKSKKDMKTIKVCISLVRLSYRV